MHQIAGQVPPLLLFGQGANALRFLLRPVMFDHQGHELFPNVAFGARAVLIRYPVDPSSPVAVVNGVLLVQILYQR